MDTFGGLRFGLDARRDDAGVSTVIRQGGVTPQKAQRLTSLSNKYNINAGWTLLGCDCVARRWRNAEITPASSAPCLAPKSSQPNVSII